jgi:uncharacterized protein (TIGR02453 family)
MMVAMAASTTVDRFRGFDRAAPGFFHELAAEQSRDWFAAHKDDYQRLWLAPMEALLGEVAAALAPSYRGLKLSPPKVFRIQRDVRFAADKTPYKTHIAGVIHLGAPKRPTAGAAAMYCSFGTEEYSGAGHYVFEPDQLARWRKLVAADKTGREIATLVAGATRRGMEISAHETLVRVPRPYDAEHPRAELLRRKGLIVGFPDIPRGLIHQPGLVKWLVGQAKAAAPIVTWLARRIA